MVCDGPADGRECRIYSKLTQERADCRNLNGRFDPRSDSTVLHVYCHVGIYILFEAYIPRDRALLNLPLKSDD
jgi:hypothetical protein